MMLNDVSMAPDIGKSLFEVYKSQRPHMAIVNWESLDAAERARWGAMYMSMYKVIMATKPVPPQMSKRQRIIYHAMSAFGYVAITTGLLLYSKPAAYILVGILLLALATNLKKGDFFS